MMAATAGRLRPQDVLAAVGDLDHESKLKIQEWFRRGDGVAIYENVDLGSATLGSRQYVSFGSEAAQLEGDEPPEQLPDIGSAINWRYRLIGSYRPVREQVAS